MAFCDFPRSLRLFARLFLVLPLAAAQTKEAAPAAGAPVAPCHAAGAPDFAGLRVFNGTAPVPLVSHCGEQGGAADACLTQSLDLAKPDVYQGDLIAPGVAQGAWTCAMVGGWSGWVPTDRLASVPASPAITTRQWLGTWVDAHVGTSRDRMVLTRSAAGNGKIHVEGKAYYTNIAHNVASGEVSGDALAKGPFLHVLDTGEQPGCVLDLKYDVSSETLRAVDNQLCGGFNVSFDGVWRRVSSKK